MTERPTGHHDRPANRLAREKSPYLLQHAHNPVDWYPWGDEAFAKARNENKPIFLSIGYSTCHWCHVMERESFENDAVAALLNAHFVAVKVDREERPDVDRIYMTSMQALGSGGGWPLNVFLTPDLEPFFGGTYFPPDGMRGRPGMLQVLPRVHEAWLEQRDDLAATGAKVLEAVAALAEGDATGDRAPAERDARLAAAAANLARAHDDAYGGFGTEPKFPSTVNLAFLMRWWFADPASRGAALEMVRRQLDAMQAGGIHDQIGGGFHRYSVDRVWLVPHFEKMLYDQAQLAWAYLEGYQVTGDFTYADTARGIFEYVERDLTSPAGAFYSAEDADSEGEEGLFYVWRPEELEAALGVEATLFAERFGVTARGNFEGRSILHRARDIEDVAATLRIPKHEAKVRIGPAAKQLLEARGSRVRPHLDDKVLASWNGLMISAFARGDRVFGSRYGPWPALRAAEFAWEHLRDPNTGALHRRWRDGEVSGAGQLDDHAYLAHGFLDLYAASFDPVWLERAAELTETMVARFHDPKAGGFFETPEGDPSIKVRMKDGFDGAEIAGNSIAAQNLLVLGRLLDRRDWLELAERALDHFAARLGTMPTAMPQLLAAMLLAQAEAREIVIVGDPAATDVRAMVAAFDRRFLPHDRLLVAGGAHRERLAKLAPFTAALESREGKATAYVCVGRVCRLPTTDLQAFEAELDRTAPAPPAATGPSAYRPN